MIEFRHPVLSRLADYFRLATACVLSLLFHAAMLGGISLIKPRPPALPEPLMATLMPPPQPQLTVEEPAPEPPLSEPPPPPVELPKPPALPPLPPIQAPKPPVQPPPQPPTQAAPAPTPAAIPPNPTAQRIIEAAKAALRQMESQSFYPEDAIAQGLEGEVLVRLTLDESGNAVSARLERSSGYAVLDVAAVRAARSVRSLPAGTPREFSLPVRFRLR